MSSERITLNLPNSTRFAFQRKSQNCQFGLLWDWALPLLSANDGQPGKAEKRGYLRLGAALLAFGFVLFGSHLSVFRVSNPENKVRSRNHETAPPPSWFCTLLRQL